jgi:hypothetical protein
MPRVKCTRENASDLISGVVFEDGISVEVTQEIADRFISIGGYELVKVPVQKKAAPVSDAVTKS